MEEIVLERVLQIWAAGSVVWFIVAVLHTRYGTGSDYTIAYVLLIIAWPVVIVVFIVCTLLEFILSRVVDPLVFRFTGRRKND